MAGKRYGSLVQEIADDRLAGAHSLARRGAAALAAFALECPALSAGEFWAELVAFAQALHKAQPAMAPLLHLADRALRAAQGLTDAIAMRGAVRQAAEAFSAQLKVGVERIAQAGAGLLVDGITVMTVSSSSAVAGVLQRACREGKWLRVICPESRPLCEGRDLARQLATAGIEVLLTVDAAAPGMVALADLVLVGADGVTEQVVINKVGTYPLALAAQAHAVPVYVLAGEEKFWPPGVTFEITNRDPAEVWAEPVAGVSVVNRYFEEIPLSLFAGVVTAAGILTAEQVRRQVSVLQVHPALMGGNAGGLG